MQRIPSNGGENQASDTPSTSDPAHAYHLSAPEPTGSFTSLPQSSPDINGRIAREPAGGDSNKSGAPTLATTPDLSNNDNDQSKNGTHLAGGAGMSSHSGGGSNSIFSSSNHSSRSLTTTLTTIQSTAPSTHLQAAGGPGNLAAQQAATGAAHGHQHQPSYSSSVYFQHQYPTTPVASAIPAHVQTPSSIYTASHLPTTYRSATANNLLTDNASILTLASSSQQQGRRNSLDTTASVRAIAPSSQWGGSRESLPLSTLSATTDAPGTLGHNMASQRPSMSGIPATERASVYSNQGVNAPVLSSERNSIYTGRTGTAGGASTHNTISDNASLKERAADNDRSSLKAGDGASVKSGFTGTLGSIGGHGRNDSIANSIGAVGGGGGGSLHGVGSHSPAVASPALD